jgi:hypothetical protein
MEDRVIRAALSAGGYTGTGTFIRDGSGEPTDQYRYGAHYHLDGVMAVPGPGAIAIRAPQLGMASIDSFLSQLNMPEPTRPFQCRGASSTEEYTIELPKRVRVDSLPKDVDLHSRNASYRARYRLKGSTVTVTREIDDRTPGPVCSPQDYVDFKPFGAAILRDVRAQIIYR